jgi:hypothetical protein
MVMAARYQNLKQTLWIWTREALDLLQRAEPVDYSFLPSWASEDETSFHFRHRPTPGWKFGVDLDGVSVHEFASWRAVLRAISEDPELERQFDHQVGTEHGSAHLRPWALAMHVLPGPQDVDRAAEIFEVRYREFEEFLAADRLSFVAVWPVQGLSLETGLVALEESVELGQMSNTEIVAALSTGILGMQPRGFGHETIFIVDDYLACLRYHYTLPKIVQDPVQGKYLGSEPEEFKMIDRIEETYEQATALLPSDFPLPTGRLQLAAQWMVHGGSWMPAGENYGVTPNFRSSPYRRRHRLGEPGAAQLKSIWAQLLCPRAPEELRLAARRFGYRRERHRPQDRLVDVLVAAESLYLTGGTTELSYRLALNAARYCDPQALQMTRRQIFDLMKDAYGIRSSLVHGGSPKAGNLKVRGDLARLDEVIAAIEDVVRQGLMQALDDATTGMWPPDWTALLLSD